MYSVKPMKGTPRKPRPAHGGGSAREREPAYGDEEDVERAVAELRELLRARPDPVWRIVTARALRGVTRAIAAAGPQAMAGAASEASDVAVVVRALEQPQAIEALRSGDPMAAARLRGLRERERLLEAERGAARVADVADLLHLTRQAVNRRRQQGTLLALSAGRHGFLYPVWQFREGGTLPGLERVLRAMTQLDPWMQQAFMLGRSSRLRGRRPLDVLRSGETAAVAAAAEAFGEHGAA